MIKYIKFMSQVKKNFCTLFLTLNNLQDTFKMIYLSSQILIYSNRDSYFLPFFWDILLHLIFSSFFIFKIYRFLKPVETIKHILLSKLTALQLYEKFNYYFFQSFYTLQGYFQHLQSISIISMFRLDWELSIASLSK